MTLRTQKKSLKKPIRASTKSNDKRSLKIDKDFSQCHPVDQALLLQDQKKLLTWYKEHQRILPWRASKDPYKIWISEVMLQQTTVAAVMPFYERFIHRFPTVQSLATSPIEDVLEHWAGLGYYSRARNLHKSAKMISQQGFPQSYIQLLEFPGMGPYTTRAISSIAFGEKVGVLDGNVIRVLSRKYGLKWEWWKTIRKNQLQQISDDLAQCSDPSSLNQGLMELGATICSPQKVSCGICPWSSNCIAREKNLIETLPLKKPKKQNEIWIWKVSIPERKSQLGLIVNNYAPFLKGQMIFPGQVLLKAEKPKKFDAKHTITHHEIFIQLESPKNVNSAKNLTWIERTTLKRVNPASLLTKVLTAHDKQK